MVAEKGNEKSGTALAALVRALHNKQSVAHILFLPRVSEKTGGNPAICAGTPVLVSPVSSCVDTNFYGHADMCRLATCLWVAGFFELGRTCPC